MNVIDEYLDGELDTAEVRAVEHHAGSCASCHDVLQETRQLRSDLAGLPIEGPREGFFDEALGRAMHSSRRTDGPGKPWHLRFGGAMAAAFAALFIAGALLNPVKEPSSADIPEVTIAMHEVTPVNLRFSSEVALQDARVSLQLPEGVQLAGFSGRDRLTWTTNLNEGNNILRLPLVGHLAQSSTLIATLEHPSGSKSFELQVTVI